MLRKTLVISAAALLCMGASPKHTARPQKPASAPAAPAPASPGAVDARDPASLIALLDGLGAKAQIARREGDAVFLTITSPTEVFSAQFAGCDAQGRNCQALLFDRQGAEGAPTSAQINAFNQTSVMCRVYQDKAGRPHVEYSTLLFPGQGRAELLMHLNAWRGCIGDFTNFARDPAGFLAGAA
jgi:hypothetical protein